MAVQLGVTTAVSQASFSISHSVVMKIYNDASRFSYILYILQSTRIIILRVFVGRSSTTILFMNFNFDLNPNVSLYHIDNI